MMNKSDVLTASPTGVCTRKRPEVAAGGTAPMVSNWLIETLKQPLAPVFYIIAYGLFGLAVMWPMAETNARKLDQ